MTFLLPLFLTRRNYILAHSTEVKPSATPQNNPTNSQQRHEARPSTRAGLLKQSSKLKELKLVKFYRKKYGRTFKRVALLAGLATMFVFVGLGYQSPTAHNSLASATSSASGSSDTIKVSADKVSASVVVAQMAEMANLSIATNVANASISLSSKADLSQSDDTLISKPQIVDNSTARGIKSYVTVAGDNVTALASKYNVSADTIRWANNLTGDALTPGTTLSIPAISGVVYTVKSGDTSDSLATKYKSDASRIISYNDLELSGLKDGQKIVIPAGVLPDTEKPGYVAPRTTAATYSTLNSTLISSNAGNMYDYGYCTWYAYNRRAQLGLTTPGSNWGNANTWDNYARSDGRFSVSSTPHIGDIAQSDYMSYWGHVAIVEAVSADGSEIKFSDMNNIAGWGRVGYSDWVPASYFTNYIH